MKDICDNELVSVVVPVYNVSLYLDRCLSSITSQTYRNIEILLIDDGSNDGSEIICQKWSEKDPRIVLYRKPNEGLGAARNDGIRFSKGKYIAFIDSDDWWELDAVEKLYKSAQKYESDIVYMNFYWETLLQNGEHEQREFVQYCLFDGVSDGHSNPNLIFSNDARTWSKFYRRDLFVDNKISFPCHPFEDFPINPILVLCSKRISQVHEPLYHYECKRPGSITVNQDNFKYIPIGLNELFKAFKERGFYSEYEKPLKKYAIRLARNVINNESIQEKVMESFLDFLDLNCKPFFNSFKFTFSYYGSHEGYQIIQKNLFKKQINDIALDNNDYIINSRGIEASIADSDYLIVDILGKEASFSDSPRDIEEYINELLNIIYEKKVGKIVFLELYYAEKHGISADNTVCFREIDEIKASNDLLKSIYEVVRNYDNSSFISVDFQEFDNYTYEHTPNGCKPKFYNGTFYEKSFEKIERILGLYNE